MDKLVLDIEGEKEQVPLVGRPSVSFLLGAGFSVPKGYPTGGEMNDNLQRFHEFSVNFSPAGALYPFNEGGEPRPLINQYQRRFAFCKDLISFYATERTFDYEEFFDFIKGQDIYSPKYQAICEEYIDEFNDYKSFVNGLPNIYNQMTAYLLEDKEGKSWYDDEPFRIGDVPGYTGILKYIQSLSKKYRVNIHTLNHDLLFESFNKTEIINGEISDGFDEYGSEYYGVLSQKNIRYHCRLERYTGRYNRAIRLYKLHGSLNYALYHRTKDGCILLPDKYVKLKYGIGPENLIRGLKRKMRYEEYPFEYHADFLTGTTSKIARYNNPFLFKKLFANFRKNLRNSEMLIIIGYGAKDAEINKILQENFDCTSNPVYIIDPFANKNEAVQMLAKRMNAKILVEKIEKVDESMFTR